LAVQSCPCACQGACRLLSERADAGRLHSCRPWPCSADDRPRGCSRARSWPALRLIVHGPFSVVAEAASAACKCRRWSWLRAGLAGSASGAAMKPSSCHEDRCSLAATCMLGLQALSDVARVIGVRGPRHRSHRPRTRTSTTRANAPPRCIRPRVTDDASPPTPAPRHPPPALPPSMPLPSQAHARVLAVSPHGLRRCPCRRARPWRCRMEAPGTSGWAWARPILRGGASDGTRLSVVVVLMQQWHLSTAQH